MTVVLNSLSGNSYILFFCRISFYRFILFLCLGHFPLLLYILCHFVLVSAHLKKQPLLFLYALAFYRGRPSPISLPRDSESFSSLFCGCIFPGFVREDSQLEEFAGCLFQEFIIPVPCGVCLLYPGSSESAAHCSALLSSQQPPGIWSPICALRQVRQQPLLRKAPLILP